MRTVIVTFAFCIAAFPIHAQTSDEKFCLAEFCIGDAMETHTKALKLDGSRLRNPWCPGQSGSSATGKLKRDGMSIQVTFKPDPKYLGQPADRYYRLVEVIVQPDKPLSPPDHKMELEKIVSRTPSLKAAPMGGWKAKDIFSSGDNISLNNPRPIGDGFYLRYRPSRDISFSEQPGCTRKGSLGL